MKQTWKVQLAITAISMMVFLGALYLVFGDVLFKSDRTFAFRDSGHYYFRLFAWCETEWDAERIPLWNPYENTGIPQVADASSSVFYPGKLIFRLPGLEYVQAYNLYIVSHIAFAALGVWWAGRRLRLDALGCGIAILSYAFGGVLLTQVSNVVFLVGAAWLPWGVGAILLMRGKPMAGSLQLAAVLAMMVLGGDPQMAYHTILIGLVASRCFRVREYGGSPDEEVESEASLFRRGINWFEKQSGQKARWISFAALLGLLLSAIQVLPSAMWSRNSSRNSYQKPRSVYESVGFATGAVGDEREPMQSVPYAVANGMIGEPDKGTHAEQIYQFSQPPWTLAELAWPNISGRMYPVHRRWVNGIAGADRVWNPSLYVGVIPLVLGLSCFSLRRSRRSRRFLSWVFLLSILASLGWFGIGWILREVMWLIAGMPPDQIKTGSPTGGLYWVLVTCLPLYAQFRFPAKWMVVAVLALALLAGTAVRDARLEKRIRNGFVIYGSFSLALLLLSFGLRGTIVDWFDSLPPDPLFGPLVASSALADITTGLVHGLTLAVLGCIGWVTAVRVPRSRSWLSIGALMLIATDVAIANRWIAHTESIEAWAPPTAVQEKHSGVEGLSGQGAAPMRTYRGNLFGWMPSDFQTGSSEQRLREVVSWDSQTSFPKHHFATETYLAESYSSIAAADFEVFMQVARENGAIRRDGMIELPAQMLDLLSVRHTVVPEPGIWNEVDRQYEEPIESVASAWRGVRPHPYARAWLVGNVEVIDPPQGIRREELARASREVLFHEGQWRDLRTEVVLESTNAEVRRVQDEETQLAGVCVITHYQPQEIRLAVATNRPAVLVLNDYYAPGWHATLVSEDGSERRQVSILRANRIFRGIVIPEGKWIVEMTYRPGSFYVGAALSAIAAMCWFIMLLGAMRADSRRKRKT